jgi:hypothetical protein
MIQIIGKLKEIRLALYNRPRTIRKYIELILEHEN